jgi:hypothetical protein
MKIHCFISTYGVLHALGVFHKFVVQVSLFSNFEPNIFQYLGTKL